MKFFYLMLFFLLRNFFLNAEESNFLENNKERIIINKNVLIEKTDYEWTVIGAGVAGIIAIAVLLDLGIPPESIYWIDPMFNVGRIGSYYQNVTANTANKFWVNFLKASPTIEKITQLDIDYISGLDQNGYNNLGLIAAPMQKVTDYFKTIISCQLGFTDSLEFFDEVWHVGVNNNIKSSRNIILATGCKPMVLNYSQNADTIPLDYALNPELLKEIVQKNDVVGVFGGSHSAILILKYLTSLDVKYIYNFYKHPFLYAVDMGDWVLHNNNGLKGETALWAKKILENNPPVNLIRIKNTDENRKNYLPLCTKIIYAIGYEKNTLPTIVTDETVSDEFVFDPQTGIIGTRIFGIGLAFPGNMVDPLGNKEQLIGLNSFMRYALQVMPDWVKKKISVSKDSLFRLLNQLYIFDKVLQISLL